MCEAVALGVQGGWGGLERLGPGGGGPIRAVALVKFAETLEPGTFWTL